MLPISAFAEKAKTIEDLAAMYDSARCKECHAEIYARWENSHHARSLMGVQDGLMMSPLAMKGLTPFSPDDPVINDNYFSGRIGIIIDAGQSSPGNAKHISLLQVPSPAGPCLS